jgi:hypothetical protein
VDDSQFELLGVVPGDVEGAVKEVTLRTTGAAAEDASFRETLADLAASRGGIYATAFANLDARHPTVTARVDTPFDGVMSLRLFSPFGARLTLVAGDSGAIIRTTTASFSHTICGERALRIRISGPVGKRYRFVVHTP